MKWLLLILLGGCAAGQVVPAAPSPVVEEEEELPTYWQCAAYCERDGKRTIGTFNGACQCGPWEAYRMPLPWREIGPQRTRRAFA